jgi:gliding motility-associated-like protein
MVVACCASLPGQTVIAFQGAEPGNNWAYTATGASAIANSEAQSVLNYSSGSRSIVSGGLSGGGSCISGGSGNGQSINNIIAFAEIDLSAYSSFNKQLSFHYGNRFPSCGGTGFDWGENLTFTPILNGVTQPSQVIHIGANNATLNIQQTSFVYAIPFCASSFGFELRINLNRNDEFLFVDDVSLTTQGSITSPALQCWQTLSFNSASGICEVTGILPQQPLVECWQTASFNATTCSWDVAGTLPQQPLSINCWDNYQFDATLCAWVNEGVQPQQPTAVNCWDAFVFNTATCQWDNIGTQPPAPNNLVCGQTTVFNETTCDWDLISTTPEPASANCWDDFVYNITLCSWENIGVQPLAPTVACYETAVFNPIICEWEVQGSQPLQPVTACYQSATFNTVSCSWDVTGTQPLEPAFECWQTASFDNVSCEWEVTGVPFSVEISSLSFSDVAPWSASFLLEATHAVASSEWMLDGVVVSSEETWDYLFTDAGNYQLMVSAVSTNGCIAQDMMTITLEPNTSHLIIPGSFTPNFDGINDLFTVVAENIVKFEMLIYNRWGELLFQTNSIEPGWLGFSDLGYFYPDGIYMYRVNALGKDGQIYERSGSVTLFR